MQLSEIRTALEENLGIDPGDDPAQQMLWNISKALLEMAKGIRDLANDIDRLKK